MPLPLLLTVCLRSALTKHDNNLLPSQSQVLRPIEELPDPGRRRALGMFAGAMAAAATFGIPLAGASPSMQGDAAFWSAPRQLWLRREHTGEQSRIVYWKDGIIDMDGYRAASWMLRDTHINQMVAMDPRLLDLLCAMQAWTSFYGFHRPIQINSGYRSRYTNEHTEGAAKNSMHMYGKAVDLVLPGLPAIYTGQLAAHYAAGGVGFYFVRDFIHVDTGRRRFWQKS
jgi:uncharacterized protein YcbK (DUF882 family)